MEILHFKEIVARALAEDLGHGDITTDSIFNEREEARALVKTKEAGIICGLAVAQETFDQVDSRIKSEALCHDGDAVCAGSTVLCIAGPIRGILKGERVALNFMQRLSGIATATQKAVASVKGTKARIVDTRKTTPGLRMLEKYAVRKGGGFNHRFNLSGLVMIKDNHIQGAGSITKAVELVRREVGFTVKIEVEAETLEEVTEALSCGADIIMLDNMNREEMVAAVRMTGKKALLEASGGITADRLQEVAATGVDIISLGFLTHSSSALDLSLELSPLKQ